MRAVILSAGQGKRLLPLTKDLPKCLLSVGLDITLLGWQLSQLADADVKEAVVVTGFRSDKVEGELDRRRDRTELRVRGLCNSFYAVADNLASVWMARGEMTEDFLLLNGDTLFEAAVARRLLAAPAAPITVTVSRKSDYDADDMKVRLEGGRLTDISKTLEPGTVDGESIGMMLFRGEGVQRFRDAVDEAMETDEAMRAWYLTVIDRLAKETAVATVEAAQAEWCEVDFPVDLQRARDAVRRWNAGVASTDLDATANS